MLTSEPDVALAVAPSRRPLRTALPTGRGAAARPTVGRALILHRLLEAYGHVRLDETVRQLALDALRCDPLDEVRPSERAWLIATLEVSGREVADRALEELADALAGQLDDAPESICLRVAQPSPWRPAGG